MNPIPSEIIYCYAEWQPAYNILQAEYNVKFNQGIPSFDKWEYTYPRLVIIDDLMSETDERVSKLFTKGSHHKNISVIYMVQNLFVQNKYQRTITLNSHYLVLFKNPRDASQITHLAKQMFPGNIKILQESFKAATEKPHGYLVIDLKQNTPDHLRLRTNIFPPEYQVVFIQK